MRLCVREMQTEAADGGTQIDCVGVCMHAHGFRDIYLYIYMKSVRLSGLTQLNAASLA